MSRLPKDPVSPRAFFEDVVPALFADLDLQDEALEVELKIGVVLDGESEAEEAEEGGAWTMHLVAGELAIESGRDEACDATVVQSVRDWRSALWEGRPQLIAEAIRLLTETEPDTLQAMREANRPGNPDALRELGEMRGLIEIRIAGGESAGGEVAEGDWRLAVLIGPGPIPESAQATVLLGEEEAEAMRRGLLHPVEALMTGQLRLEGDLGLIIRLQAVAMAASLPVPPRR